MAKEVFLSYSRKDMPFAEQLEADLVARGITLWRDLVDIEVGTPDWEEETRKAIIETPFFVLLASPDSRQSRIVKDEIRLAELHKRIVLPLWIAGELWVDAVSLKYVYMQHIDMREGAYQNGLQVLVKRLKRG